jgi:hypothetical protein
LTAKTGETGGILTAENAKIKVEIVSAETENEERRGVITTEAQRTRRGKGIGL